MPGGLGRDFSRPAFKDEIEAKLSALPLDHVNKFWRLYSQSQNRLSPIESEQRRLLLELFHDASDDVVSVTSKIFDQLGVDNWDLRTVRRFRHDEMLFRAINDRIRALGGRVNAQVEDGMMKIFKQTYLEDAYRLDQMTPEDIQFGLIPDRQILALLHEPFNGASFSDRLGVITDDMAGAIRKTLLRSMINQESWQQAARSIRGEMGTRGQKAVWRAEMIARTELRRASSIASAQFNAENEDVIDKLVWMAHPGACALCLSLNGTEVEDAEDYPPEQSHPNCTCTVVAVPKPWSEIVGDPETAVPPPKISFDAWVEQRGMSHAASR